MSGRRVSRLKDRLRVTLIISYIGGGNSEVIHSHPKFLF